MSLLLVSLLLCSALLLLLLLLLLLVSLLLLVRRFAAFRQALREAVGVTMMRVDLVRRTCQPLAQFFDDTAFIMNRIGQPGTTSHIFGISGFTSEMYSEIINEHGNSNVRISHIAAKVFRLSMTPMSHLVSLAAVVKDTTREVIEAMLVSEHGSGICGDIQWSAVGRLFAGAPAAAPPGVAALPAPPAPQEAAPGPAPAAGAVPHPMMI